MALAANFTNQILSDLHPNNIRYLFYMVDPRETMFSSVDDVPNYTDRSSMWFLIFIFIEFVTNYEGFAFNDTVTSINAGIMSLLFKIGGRYLSAAFYPQVWSYLHVFDMPTDSVFWWFVCFLSQDLMYYLGHRFIHEAGVFWSFHQMHHSSEYYNLSTALRQGAVQDLAMSLFDWMQCFYMPPLMFLPHKYFNILYQFWIHTETIPSLGPLEYVLNTPSAHRVHHGRNPYCIDRNYGATLIIWDRLFGTYAEEREEEKVVYGLVSPVNSFNQFWLQFFEFKEIGYDKGQLKNDKGEEIFPGFWNKVKAALYPPGYFPGVKTKFFFLWRYMNDNEEGIPPVDIKNVVKYCPKITFANRCYLLVQFLAVLYLGLNINEYRTVFTWQESISKFAVMMVSMQSFGYYFDLDPRAASFDVSRLFFVAAVGYYFQELEMFIFAIMSILSVLLQRSTGQIPSDKSIVDDKSD